MIGVPLIEALFEREFFVAMSRERVYELLTPNKNHTWESPIETLNFKDIHEILAHAHYAELLKAGEVARSFSLDAEDLSEGSSDMFANNMSGFLAHLGIAIRTCKEIYKEEDDTAYLVINGRHFILRHPWEREDGWRVDSNHFSSAINVLLVEHGAAERFFVCDPYVNDQTGIFLTPDLLRFIVEIGQGGSFFRIGAEFEAPQSIESVLF